MQTWDSGEILCLPSLFQTMLLCRNVYCSNVFCFLDTARTGLYNACDMSFQHIFSSNSRYRHITRSSSYTATLGYTAISQHPSDHVEFPRNTPHVRVSNFELKRSWKLRLHALECPKRSVSENKTRWSSLEAINVSANKNCPKQR